MIDNDNYLLIFIVIQQLVLSNLIFIVEMNDYFETIKTSLLLVSSFVPYSSKFAHMRYCLGQWCIS